MAGLRERLQSYIRHLEWASWARANMESAEAAAPIVLNGFWGAKPVIGVMLPGVALVAMRGRSVSSQAWEGTQMVSAGDGALGIARSARCRRPRPAGRQSLPDRLQWS